MKTVNIEVFNKSHLEGVRKLMLNTDFKSYRYFMRDIPIEKINNYLNKQISEALSGKLGTFYVALRKSKVVGLGILEELEWDSNIFEIKMARINNLTADDTSLEAERVKDSLLRFLSRESADRGIKHLSCKVNTDDFTSIHALERNRFNLMDTVLDYTFDFRKYPIKDFNPPCVIRSFKEKDINSIVEVAREAFSNHFGRFHSDKRLRKRAVELYAKWAENACQGYGDIVFVAELNKRIIGYSVWRIPNLSEKLLGIRIGSYNIGVVRPDAHGKGIFKALTLAGMKWFEGKVDIIEGPTHVNNYPVQRGYATLMWKIVDARHTFHKWIRNETNQ